MIKKIFQTIMAYIDVVRSLFIPRTLRRTSRKLKKWLKKNRKEQNPNLYPFDYRWNKILKKTKKCVNRMNVKIILHGEDNLLKGPMWITPNHTSNFDGFYIVATLGQKRTLTPIAKAELFKHKLVSGFMYGTDAFSIDKTKPREAIQSLKAAANYSKQNNRSIVVFPEGKRSFTTELNEFNPGAFAFAQQYALPILPMTITGTLDARRWWVPKRKVVNIYIHKPIKPIEHMKISREIIAKRVYETVNKSLLKWEKSLSPKEKDLNEELKKKALKKMNKNET